MPTYTTQILKFDKQGEKTGWTYIEVPADVAEQLIPGNKKTFRVKGTLDSFPISGIALLPMGGGAFIMALNAAMRKGIRKKEGAVLTVSIEVDTEYTVKVPEELNEFFRDDKEAEAYFYSLAKSHRDYFVKWIDSAKTSVTREKRLVETARALSERMSYSQMIRALKKEK